MKHPVLLPMIPVLLSLMATGLDAADQPAAAAAAPAGDDAASLRTSVSYQVGLQMGDSVAKYNLDADQVAKGIKAMIAGSDKPMDQEKFRDVMTKYMADLAKHQSAGNQEYLDTHAKKPGVKVLPDGLQYEIISSGTGKTPLATDTVKVAYKGTMPNGSVFDSSENHGGSVSFQVGGVIKGWTEILQMMKEGDKFLVTVPPELGYGTQGAPPTIPPNQILIFEITLIQVNPPAEPAGAAPGH